VTNNDKYNSAFTENFSVDGAVLADDLEYNSIPEWDSIGHMSLIASIEETFDITMEIDDIVEFSSYGKGKEIMSKYGVTIQ